MDTAELDLWLSWKWHLHCFSPTGRSDLAKSWQTRVAFSLNFADLKQRACVQAHGRGDSALGCGTGPTDWSQGQPGRLDIGHHLRASQQITGTPLWASSSLQLDLHSPYLGQLVLGWRQDFLLLEPGISGKLCLLPPPSPALADGSQHPPLSASQLCWVC